MKTERFDIYSMVTDMMISRLEAGIIPWQMPWKSALSMPTNMVSKKPYRGINFWYLLSFGFEKPWFLTFNQIKELGGSVIKGSKSYVVVFWKILENEKPTGEINKVPMLRYYRIFHIDSVEGIDQSKIPTEEAYDHDFNPIEHCENLVNGWVDCPNIVLNKAQALYKPGSDTVEMPNPRNFFGDESYYSALYHELIHSTGHKRRLNRHEKFPDNSFASKDYSIEELIAEMGAAFLCGISGIQTKTFDNSVGYVQSWLKRLKNDNKFVLSAASHAQHAVDYILENQKVPASSKLAETEAAVTSSFSF